MQTFVKSSSTGGRSGRSPGSQWGDEMSGRHCRGLPVSCWGYGPGLATSYTPAPVELRKGCSPPQRCRRVLGLSSFLPVACPKALHALMGVLGQTGVEEGLCCERSPCPQGSQTVFVSYIPAQDQERRTPLHAAAYVGDVAILELLILSGKGQDSGQLARVLALPLRRLSDLWP